MRLDLQTPKDSFDELARMMGQMMDDMTKRDFYPFSSREDWEPAITFYETESVYILFVDLAGMKRKEIDVRTVGRRLIIQGDRPHPQVGEPKGTVRVHMMEIQCGSFRRELELPPDVDEEAIEAAYRDGYLRLVMPRASSDANRK